MWSSCPPFFVYCVLSFSGCHVYLGKLVQECTILIFSLVRILIFFPLSFCVRCSEVTDKFHLYFSCSVAKQHAKKQKRNVLHMWRPSLGCDITKFSFNDVTSCCATLDAVSAFIIILKI